MSDNVTAIKGFADLFSPDSDAFTHMEAVARETFSRYGFTELRTPILERTELFCRGIGTETDVVQKEMYTFPDRKGRDAFTGEDSKRIKRISDSTERNRKNEFINRLGKGISPA